jgi:biopolymer transport protein ExbD
MNWLVRPEGTDTPIALASSADVLAGLRDGIWRPTDDVKGPDDAGWTTIESHPAFHEAAEELEPLPPEHDDTHLDMNPLIDVCLVLLIFFILTITYASLERAIDVPESTPEGATTKPINVNDIKGQVFRVTAKMDGETPVILVEKEAVKLDDLADKIKHIIEKSGRHEMLLDIDGNVPWGVQTAILDAAKGNNVRRILYHPRSRR